jgi:hypothetical protein
MPDLTDVGISSVLHAGFSFFGLLNTVSATLPYGWGGHERRDWMKAPASARKRWNNDNRPHPETWR